MNNVTIVGRLTRDPELRYIPGSGTPVATFTMAVDRDYRNRDGSTTTDFIPVEVMGKPAEFVANYISKGNLVGVNGSIRVDRYETPNGEKRSFTKVAGRNIRGLESKAKAEASASNNPNNDNINNNVEAPVFKPSNIVDVNGFNAVADDDVPF